MTRKWPRYAAVALGLAVAPAFVFVAQHVLGGTERRIIEREAVKVAEVVAQQAMAARAAYSTVAPEPADAFLNRVGEQSRRLSADAYAYRWLALGPGPQPQLDGFQRWAWDRLQQQAHAQPRSPGDWQAAWRFVEEDGQPMLRYMRGVPTLQPDCEGCAPGGEPSPIEGAMEVRVPLEQVAAFAAVQTRATQNLLLSLGALGFMVVTLLAVRSAREQRGLARRYEQLATVDALTGLANRRAIEDSMGERLAHARSAGEGLGVMFIDVDDFKDINDSLGHAAGDEVLRVIAGRLARVLRSGDLLARYSGDEFVVFAGPVKEPARLAQVAAKLLEAMGPAVGVMGNDIFVTLSIGIAHYPTDGTDVATLLKHADSAMYRAKEKGRNSFQFFAAEMNAAALEKLQMSSNLWHALRRNEFVVHYQPKANAATGRIVGFEALVRWNHPEHGLIPPGRFIPHAENSGAIEPLGEWVLVAALAQLRGWRDADLFHGSLAVNLSMRQLYNPELPLLVKRALERNAIAPGQLELEVTESMVSVKPDLAARTLRELAKLGVAISLDDFGTGQSSLAYLLRFPIAKLKVDRSFTMDLLHCEDARAIVRAIIALARSLRMRVVGEGVETPEQQAFFREEGCDEVQGYLVGKPMTVDEATRLLEAESRRNTPAPRLLQAASLAPTPP